MPTKDSNSNPKVTSTTPPTNRQDTQANKPTCHHHCDPSCPYRQNKEPRKWLSALLVAAVAIAFLLSSVEPGSPLFAQLWPVVQAAFWIVVIYYFTEHNAK